MSKIDSEKTTYINTNVLLNNAPKESDDYAVEAEILDAQVKSPGVNNIAIVAPYGAGKSSAITTYLNRYRRKVRRQPKHIQISLADFNTEENEVSKLRDTDNENAIEQSILQQLLYNQKKQKLPNSNIQRTNKSNPWTYVGWGSLLVVFLLSLVTFIFEFSGAGLFVGLVKNNAWIKPASLCIMAVSLVALIIWLIRVGKLRSLKYKDFEIGIVNNAESSGYSLINKYIDEVLYFFECINVDLVIFEDLDRFDSLRIFVKLRELNTIINNSPKKAKKVTFIYAVKDDMFADEKERSKFFEFILPIVPIINPITTSDNIRKISDTLNNDHNSLSLSEQFIKDISYFVSDMRVLKNAFNDYIIMANKLSDNSDKRLHLKKENLFALALYKNLYPYDYSRLQGNNGLIPLCVDKDRAVEYFLKDSRNRIKELETEREKISKETLMDFEELKLIFKGQHFNLNLHHSAGAQNVDNIKTFKDVTQLMHPQNNYYSVPLQHLPNGETYYEREKRIKAKEEKSIVVIDEKLRELYREIDGIENNTFNELISKIGIDDYFSEERIKTIRHEYKEIIANTVFAGNKSEEIPIHDKSKGDNTFDKQTEYIRLLINKGYIDENYIEYISAYKSDLSVNDREFISSVKMGYCKSPNYRLDNVKVVIREFNEDDFLQPAIIVSDICKSLDIIKEVDDENDIKTIKYNNLMRLFRACKDSVVKAVYAFLMVADKEEKHIFGKHVVEDSVELVEALFGEPLVDEDKDMLVILLAKSGKNVAEMDEVRKYLCEHEQYASLLKEIDPAKQREFVSKGQLIFEKLDISCGRGDLFEYIVQNNYYTLNVGNIRKVLSVDENNNKRFEKKNYTFIQESNNEILKARIEKDMNSYIKNVYVKLPIATESEKVIRAFLANDKIEEENKLLIITHTDFKVEKLDSVDSIFYSQLLNENKVSANWMNLVQAYKVLGFDESLANFIKINSGIIDGRFADIEDAIQTKLFNEFITAGFDDTVIKNLADSMDVWFAMNEIFGKNNKIGPFILAGCFKFNVTDMRFLQNPPSTIPYLIVYQNEIKKDMRAFFGGMTFKPLTVKNVIEDTKISVDFKKEFVSIYGGNFDITGIEDIVANFIVENGCALEERLLYKFTNVSINAKNKLAMLSLTIKTIGINDLNGYRSYFCAIDKDFADFWSKSKKLVIESSLQNRLIAEFMKKQGLISSFITRKDKLHLNCA